MKITLGPPQAPQHRPVGPATDRPRRVRGLRLTLGWALCVCLVAVLALISFAVGSRTIGPDGVWGALSGHGNAAETAVVWQLRIPRTLLGCVVGAALGVAGVLMQALTRNPLAEPGLAGVNAGASFAVVLAISLCGVTNATGYVWFAFAGAVSAALAVHGLTRRGVAGGQHTRLVLAGAAASATLGAVTGILTMFDTATFDSYRFWVVGALENRGEPALLAAAPFTALGIALALPLGPALNALALGEEQGSALGLRTGVVRATGMLSVMLLCGAATAAAGPIAFVGLVVPHTLRLFLGPDVRWLLAYAIPAGAVLLLASDIVGRVLAPPGEIEAGIVTAFLGAPVLMWLVNRSKTGRI